MTNTPPPKIWIDPKDYFDENTNWSVLPFSSDTEAYHHDDTVRELVKALLAAPSPKDTDLLRGRNLYEYEQAHSRWRSAVTAALAPFQQEGE